MLPSDVLSHCLLTLTYLSTKIKLSLSYFRNTVSWEHGHQAHSEGETSNKSEQVMSIVARKVAAQQDESIMHEQVHQPDREGSSSQAVHQAGWRRGDDQVGVAKERSSSPSKKHGHGACQKEVISQVKPQLSQGEAQEWRGSECTEEAEPVLAWPARPKIMHCREVA